MKNVTITLDEHTLGVIRLAAAKAGKSVSRYIGDLLRENQEDDRKYEQARQAWLAQKPYIPLEPGARPPTREELYEELLEHRCRIR